VGWVRKVSWVRKVRKVTNGIANHVTTHVAKIITP
jgi:hypothetical protein